MGTSGRRRAGRLAMSVAAAGVATSVVGVAATQPASVSAPLVDLTALIAVGSSTNPSGAGVEDFFRGQFKGPEFTGDSGDDIETVNFLTGPWGINQALQANSSDPRNAVVASGWGAANASQLLSQLAARNDPVVQKTMWVLDNNVSAPNGGFGTRYPWFALIGVNPFPTPTNTGAPVVMTAYQYNYNSNAPADLFNGLAHLNSFVAYLYGYQDQQQIELPVDNEGNPTCGGSTCTVMEGDRVVAYVVKKGNTTYVTYTTDQLPLARLIRDFVPFGDQIADRIEPLLTLLVDSAYYGGNPIPADPSQYKPARLFPSLAELVETISKIPAAIQQGFAPKAPASPEPTLDAAALAADTDAQPTEEPTGDSRKDDPTAQRNDDADEPKAVESDKDSSISEPEEPTEPEKPAEADTPEKPEKSDKPDKPEKPVDDEDAAETDKPSDSTGSDTSDSKGTSDSKDTDSGDDA